MKRSIISKLGLAALLSTASASAISCYGIGDIDRTQPEKLQKSLFTQKK